VRRCSAGLVNVICTVFALCCCSLPNPGPSQGIVGWGDSLTYSLTKVDNTYQQAVPTWLDTLSGDLHVDAKNFGFPSLGSAEIAVRQGGLKPLVTLSGNQIPPASKAEIAVDAVSPSDGWSQVHDAGTLTMHGTLAGVPGSLQHTITSGVESFSFVPDAAPASAVAVPAKSVFSDDEGDPYRDHFQIIWAGANDGPHLAAILRDVASMVHWLTNPRRYVVVGTIPQITSELSVAYGPHFTDLQSWLISDGLKAARITPTPQDTEAIAAGQVPPSLRLDDGIHFTQAAYTAIGHHLASVIKTMM
jgi:hypothetical protein